MQACLTGSDPSNSHGAKKKGGGSGTVRSDFPKISVSVQIPCKLEISATTVSDFGTCFKVVILALNHGTVDAII